MSTCEDGLSVTSICLVHFDSRLKKYLMYNAPFKTKNQEKHHQELGKEGTVPSLAAVAEWSRPYIHNQRRSLHYNVVAAVAEWYRYRSVAGLVTSSSIVTLKTHHLGKRCTLDLSRAQTSSRWCGS
ncbi:hypothetical protein TNCV_1179351 [Trichonephila clavipes]|nr:hypothetical protein TNCV_1179351 [Trichonephila clavipes]